jgi:hypothetical protein
MHARNLVLGAVALLAAAACANSAYAFTEAEMIRLHEMCRAGDRDACARRDVAIHDRDHEAEWRIHHPEWYR